MVIALEIAIRLHLGVVAINSFHKLRKQYEQYKQQAGIELGLNQAETVSLELPN